MSNAIEVRDIVKKFGEFTAVSGISFDVKSGEVNQGPAKESIRTFEAQIREGKIHVRAPEP